MARRFLALVALLALALLTAACGTPSNKVLLSKTRPKLTRIGSLPQAISKAAAVSLPNGRMMIFGGLVGNVSIDTVLAGAPHKLQVVGHLPQPTHDAAAARLGNVVYLFGGGAATSTATIVVFKAGGGKAIHAGTLIEPLSDLGAVAIGGKAYLVGGYTGTQYATAILRYGPATDTVVARLPRGLRYAGVAAIGRTIYVAGGLTTSGPSRAIYAFPLGEKVRRIGTLPRPEAHAALAALAGTLYYVGGRTILAIDPHTGKSSIAAHLPRSLSDATATTVAHEIAIAGGGTSGVWAFTP